jgi:hypothetical protein
MSFMSLQLRHHESTQTLDDGTANFSHPLAFAMTLANNKSFHYGDAMKQPDKSSFLKDMINEVNNLSNLGVWMLFHGEHFWETYGSDDDSMPHDDTITVTWFALCPDSARGIQCYVDADFASSWRIEDCDEPSNVYSRTGFVILYAGYPLIWVSKLQSEVTLLTT